MEDILQAARELAQGAPDRRTAASGKLRQLLLQLKPTQACEILQQSPVDLLSALLIGARPNLVPNETLNDRQTCLNITLSLYKHVMRLLSAEEPALEDSQAAQMVAVLGVQLGYITGVSPLSEITEAATETFESDAPLSHHALDLLPLALSNLRAEVAADGNRIDGHASDYCRSVLNRVCNHPWPVSNLSTIIAGLRDFSMPPDALAEAVRRGAARARTADIQDLPAIVHQLLVLAGSECRVLALTEIVRLFDRLEESASDTSDAHRMRLMEVEGAVLLHLEMAAKHDTELGQAWVKRVKAAAWRPTSFAFALSLVLAGVQRFETAILTALEQRLVKAHADAAQCATAPWLPAQDGRGQPAADVGCVEDALLQCVRNSAHGQGAVVPPLVTLSLALMDVKRGPGSHASANLGIRVLTELFAAHKLCRKTVLATCTTRLIGSTEASALPFIRLISELVRRHPVYVEAHVHEVRAALENVALLPPGAAAGLLLALWPLCRERKDMADFLVMLLRKAMFSRELPARLLAARGFLLLIADELQRAGNHSAPGAGPSCSQAAPVMSQMDVLAGGSCGATLLHELMGFLRRCLTQQPDVRRVVYQSLPALLAADPAAAEPVAELLLPHLASFCETDDALMPPVKLEACAHAGADGSVRVVEPLPHLLACVRAVLSASGEQEENEVEEDTEDDDGKEEGYTPNEDNHSTAVPALRKLCASVCRRLCSCPLEDFSFDQSTCFAAGEAQGELSQASADILLGCYEAAMEDRVDRIKRLAHGGGGLSAAGMSARSETLADDLLALFQHHKRLSTLAADGMRGSKVQRVEGLTQAVGAGGRRGGGGGSKAHAQASGGIVPLDKRVPVLSTACLSHLLTAIVDDGLVPGGFDTAATQSAHVKIARDLSFQTFVMTACLRTLHAGSVGAGVDLAAAVSAGTGSEGIGAVEETIAALFSLPDWRSLAGPLFRGVQTTVLACARQRVPGGAVGGKKEKDPGEALMHVAVSALERLLAAGGGTLTGLADILRHVPPAAAGGRTSSDSDDDSPSSIIALRLPHFKQLFEVLVEHACSKEVEAMCGCVQTLTTALPRVHALEVSNWVTEACNDAPVALSHHSTAAKNLVALRLRCAAAEAGPTSEEDDLSALKELAICICEGVDSSGNNNGEHDDGSMAGTLRFSATERCPLLSEKTVNSLMLACVSHVDASMAQLEWALGRLKRTAEADAVAGEEDNALIAAQHRSDWEHACFLRMRRVVDATAVLAKAKLQGPPLDAIARSLTRLYKLLKSAAASQLAGSRQRQAPPSYAFQDLVTQVNAELTPQVYTFIAEVEATRTEAGKIIADDPDEENEDGNVGKRKGKSKAGKRAAALGKTKRDARSIPTLVFELESWEGQVIKVSKAGKVNLMVNAKRAVNRDFRITGVPTAKRQRVEEYAQPEEMAAEEEAEEEEEDEEHAEEEEEEGDDLMGNAEDDGDDEIGFYDDDDDDE